MTTAVICNSEKKTLSYQLHRKIVTTMSGGESVCACECGSGRCKTYDEVDV